MMVVRWCYHDRFIATAHCLVYTPSMNCLCPQCGAFSGMGPPRAFMVKPKFCERLPPASRPYLETLVQLDSKGSQGVQAVVGGLILGLKPAVGGPSDRLSLLQNPIANRLPGFAHAATLDPTPPQKRGKERQSTVKNSVTMVAC